MFNPDEFSEQAILLLVKSMTQNGSQPLKELEVERFLNALTRLQSKTPTGIDQNQSNLRKR